MATKKDKPDKAELELRELERREATEITMRKELEAIVIASGNELRSVLKDAPPPRLRSLAVCLGVCVDKLLKLDERVDARARNPDNSSKIRKDSKLSFAEYEALREQAEREHATSNGSNDVANHRKKKPTGEASNRSKQNVENVPTQILKSRPGRAELKRANARNSRRLT